jgi:hypothetical protein
MEGGSPALIRQRWTLPMYYAQRRYWADHPRTDQLVAWYLGVKPQKTAPPGKTPPNKLAWSLLDPPDAAQAAKAARRASGPARGRQR